MSAAENAPLPCPLCGTPLLEPDVRNPLSRIDNKTYICNQCGTAEALNFRLPSADCPREVLYYDEISGIMLVTENEPGYYSLFPQPTTDKDWCRHYVHEANDRLGYGPGTVNDIVLSSMAAQPATTGLL